jgi:hypothetical protein
LWTKGSSEEFVLLLIVKNQNGGNRRILQRIKEDPITGRQRIIAQVKVDTETPPEKIFKTLFQIQSALTLKRAFECIEN